jgi:hypothetical protein
MKLVRLLDTTLQNEVIQIPVITPVEEEIGQDPGGRLVSALQHGRQTFMGLLPDETQPILCIQ